MIHYCEYDNRVPFDILLGKTFTSARREKENNGEEYIVFECEDDKGTIFILCHKSECCENVYIEDICGDLSDLKNSPILLAEEETSRDGKDGSLGPKVINDDNDESYTWTFYKLSTNKGSVTIRWYGSSNGYYSESAYLYDVTDSIKEKR